MAAVHVHAQVCVLMRSGRAWLHWRECGGGGVSVDRGRSERGQSECGRRGAERARSDERDWSKHGGANVFGSKKNR